MAAIESMTPEPAAAGVAGPDGMMMPSENLGREKLPWSAEHWSRLDKAVHAEGLRTWVGRRYLPLVPVEHHVLTVPADTVVGEDRDVLSVKERAVTPLIELWVEFSLTKQQVAREESMGTAVTLAIRAANVLARAEDVFLYQGDAGLRATELARRGLIHLRSDEDEDGAGLVTTDELEEVTVEFSAPRKNDPPDKKRFGENSFGAVEEAYARLQDQGHYGPYAVVFPTEPYADAHAPLEDTLIMPADRIRPLVEGRFFGTGTLPQGKGTQPIGLMQSFGGNTVDLVVGRDATLAFVQEDTDGLYRFRVFERLALRDKVPSGRVILKFAYRGEEDGRAEGAPQDPPAPAPSVQGKTARGRRKAGGPAP